MFILSIIAAAMMVSMPAMAQKDYQEVAVDDPCPYEKFPSTAELLRGHGVGIDRNQQFSVEKARAHAITDLVSQVATTVDAVMQMTDESWDTNNESNYAGHALQEIKTAISQTTGYNIVCRQTVTYTQNGTRMMKTYLVVELGTEKAAKTVYETLSNDPKVQIDQSYVGFFKNFKEYFHE